MVDFFTREPRETSRAASRAVPTSDPAQPFTGLSGLQRSLSGFFASLERAGAQLGAAAHAREVAEIKRENERESDQAVADVLAGKAPDPSKADDNDYADAFSNTLGAKLGAEAASDYVTNHYPSLQIGDSFEAHAEGFLKEKYQNGDTFGRPDDPTFQKAFLIAFQKNTAEVRGAHRAATIKGAIRSGEENLFAAMAGSFDQDNSHDFLDRNATELRRLWQGMIKPGEAMQKVIWNAIALSRENPERLAKLERLIADAGIDKRFPEAYIAITDRIYQERSGVFSRKVADMYDGLDRAIIEAQSPDDLADALEEITVVASRFGGEARAASLRESISRRMAEVGKLEAGRNAYVLALGKGNVEPSDNTKYQEWYLESRGLLPGDASDAATQTASAKAIIAAGGTGAAVKARIQRGLLGNDLQVFDNTVRTLAATQSMYSREFVLNKVLSPEQKDRWAHAHDMFVQGTPMETIRQALLNSEEELQSAVKATYTDLKVPGDTEKERAEHVAELTTDALRGVFPGADNIVMDAATQDYLTRAIKRRLGLGVSPDSVDGVVTQAITDASLGLSVSIADGGDTVIFHQKASPEDSLNFGRNVAKDGTTVNTVDKARVDLKVFATTVSRLLEKSGYLADVSKGSLGIDMSTIYAAGGFGQVTHNGAALILPAEALGITPLSDADLNDPAAIVVRLIEQDEFSFRAVRTEDTTPPTSQYDRELLKVLPKGRTSNRPPERLAEDQAHVDLASGARALDMFQLVPLATNPNVFRVLYRPNTVELPTRGELRARIAADQAPGE